jgi:nuclease S1
LEPNLRGDLHWERAPQARSPSASPNQWATGKAVGEDVGEAATELLKTITPARIESWTHSAPMDWANESFAIVEQARTEYCIRHGASCDHPSGKVKIDAAYVAVNAPIVREQLQKSGVRLAQLLDAALGK